MRPVRTIFLFFGIGLIVPGLGGCYKAPLLPHIEYKVSVDSTSKSYFASYHTGSQWIYQKEGSGSLDTVVESSYDNEYYEYTGDPLDVGNTHYAYQNITVSYYSNISGSLTTSDNKDESDTNSTYCAIEGENASRETKGTFNGLYETFGYISATILDTFTVLNHTFTNVLYLKGVMGPGYSEIYFAKNVGIIEKKITNYPAYLLKSWAIKY